MNLSRLTAVAVATLAAACAFAASAQARPGAARCAKAGYSYAGVEATTPMRGLSARISIASTVHVTSGHAAGWIGVGGAGRGANGADEWLQVGISSVPGGVTELYYEVAQAGNDPVYTSLGSVTADESHRVGVWEASNNTWAVWLDGKQVSPAFSLPGSHGVWTPMALEESYDGGITSCNAYTFKFDDLKSSSAPGVWQPLTKVMPFVDAGHTLRSTAGVLTVGRK
jgi:hypothetical protein